MIRATPFAYESLTNKFGREITSNSFSLQNEVVSSIRHQVVTSQAMDVKQLGDFEEMG